MTEKKIFWLVVIVFVLLIIAVGMVGGYCVNDCIEKGEHTQARCYQICRP